MAVVNAQAAAAIASVEFINATGFDSTGHAKQASFVYTTTNATSGQDQDTIISIPYLTMVPIPYIEVTPTSPSFCPPSGLVYTACYFSVFAMC